MMADDWMGNTDDYLPDPPKARERAERAPPRGDDDEYRCIRYVSNACPWCGGIKIRTDRVQRTRERVYRYHRCKECGRRFKSFEVIKERKKPNHEQG